VDDIDLDEQFHELTGDLSDDEKREVIRETITSQQLGELPTRVQALSEDIYNHYQQKLAPNDWKGMVVTPSRESAVMYGETLREFSMILMTSVSLFHRTRVQSYRVMPLSLRVNKARSFGHSNARTLRKYWSCAICC